MCGIAGQVGRPAPSALPDMLHLLRHRGPDDEGVHEEPGLSLGMHRLAIIDLQGGRQPMANEDGSLWIVFNGEIYNHRELRPALEAEGHDFRTRSDTEVILHAYKQRGEACVDALRGMFAFAIWDRPRRRLLLARDRLGKKPLYYWHRQGTLLFASELKALLCHPAVSRDLDLEALHHYLAFGYTPAARSIFAEIAKLPPAHVAAWQDGVLTVREYWRHPSPGPATRRPADEVAAQVRAELREAVRLRLESDVPLGVFLSGGIDSGAVVACMREVTGERIATFSIGFGAATPSYNELPFARLVAQRFETEHTEEILEPKVLELLPSIVRHFDEPFADSSAIPTFTVAQATAQHVKVALSGIGGDETFAGYPRYLGLRLSEAYARLPRWARTGMARLLPAVLRDSEASRNYADWAHRFLKGADVPLPDRYLGWTRFFTEADLAALASPALQAGWHAPVDARQRALYERRGFADPVDGAFRIDLGSYLPDDLLTMADRMSMAHGLEVRAPFCDHRLLELSLAIPPGDKMPGLRLKGLLKKAFAGTLPPAVLSHPKQGFMIPLGRWLRTDLRPLLDELLAPEQIRRRGLFVPEYIERLKQEHLSGGRTHGDRLWTLMMLELWMREYVDGARADGRLRTGH
ncbi:MAG: asparagine synthase (glutamine-hydrolyzing) [Candidatus Methylomirabilales bacterium]